MILVHFTKFETVNNGSNRFIRSKKLFSNKFINYNPKIVCTSTLRYKQCFDRNWWIYYYCNVYYMDENHSAKNPAISIWTMQLTWLRTIHSGDWCLRSALCTLSGACQKWWWWWCNVNNGVGDVSYKVSKRCCWSRLKKNELG